MEDVRVGRALRALRRRGRLRQVDIGERAGVTQSTISLLERGRVDGLSVRAIRSVFRAVDADVTVLVRWRGGDLDRLLDERHARLGGAFSTWMIEKGWEMASEVTFSIYGERGAIDVLCWHPRTELLLVVELKTELASVEETLRRHDVKVRLAARIAAERFGWRSRSVGRLLVLADDRTSRRRVARHDGILGRAYPARSAEVRRWVGRPAGPMAGLLFLPFSDHPSAGRFLDTGKRVRRPRFPGA